MSTSSQLRPVAQTMATIRQRLDVYLDVEFTFLKTAAPAEILAALEPERQDYILTWVERVASTNTQLAYQFINQVIAVLDQLAADVIEDWALHAMDTYDQVGLHKALAVIRDVDNFVLNSHQRRVGVALADKATVLLHFSHGLSGRQLKLEATDGEAYTDTATLFLPALLASQANQAENFLLYKASVAMLWAQTRFGTFRRSNAGKSLQQHVEESARPEHFIAVFHSLENLRLEACLQRELPGLYRDMQALLVQQQEAVIPEDYKQLCQILHSPAASSEDSLRLCVAHQHTLKPYPPRSYQGSLNLPAVENCMQQRSVREKALLRVKLSELLAEQLAKKDPLSSHENDTTSDPGSEEPRFKLRREAESVDTENLPFEISLDDEPVTVSDDIKTLASSILLDFGEIPDDYLTPAGDGEYDPSLFHDDEPRSDDVWSGTYHEQGAFLYHEWDYRRQSYRKNWCALREVDITPRYDDFVSVTRQKYHGHIKHLRRTFEALRDEDRRLRRQADGDGIDIDALVEALADARDGRELSERLFTRMHRVERNIAVAFLVDMSGSTRGWINQAERESLVLLCEALESLGDRYAIYGFSGQARKRCEIYPIKDFSQPYDDLVRARISGIEAKDYTRMGAPIRHMAARLNDIEAKTRILITLSDGKPDDYDNYRGEYGIEDTRHALQEIRRDGIHPYCITIDQQAHDYLPHLFGRSGYTVVDDVSQLPHKISSIYRRLTTY